MAKPTTKPAHVKKSVPPTPATSTPPSSVHSPPSSVPTPSVPVVTPPRAPVDTPGHVPVTDDDESEDEAPPPTNNVECVWCARLATRPATVSPNDLGDDEAKPAATAHTNSLLKDLHKERVATAKGASCTECGIVQQEKERQKEGAAED